MCGDGAASSMANKCRRLNPPAPGAGASPPTGSDFKDSLLESFLLSSHPLEVPFEKLLESMPSISERDLLIDRALSRGTALIQAAERCIRKRATEHNYRVWNLLDDLTVKVSKLGIRPRQYEFSDFSPSRVAWREEMSSQKKISHLTGDCLYSLARNKSNCRLLRTLHLHHIEKMKKVPVCDLLSLCPLLLDLEIVGLPRIGAMTILDAVSKYCHSLERLLFADSRRLIGYGRSLAPSACAGFVKKCPSLTSLSIRGCRLDDTSAGILFKGFKRLKHLDFTRCPGLTGTFLRDPILCEAPVEVMILRNCTHLREDEVNWFLDSVRRGDFTCLRLIDLWIDERLRSKGLTWSPKFSVSRTLLKRLAELRPDINVVANFPSNKSSRLGLRRYEGNSTDTSLQSDERSDNAADIIR